MLTTYLFHIVAGSAALIGGFAALYTRKGGRLHRRSGMVFVYAILAMSLSGALIALARGRAPMINVPSAALSAYLVVTGLTTVRPLASAQRRLDIGAVAAAAALGLTCFALGIPVIAGGGPEAGMAYPLFMFGGMSLAAAAGDRRVVRSGPLRGAPRIARHLWRMCFALFIAAIAFFIGQPQVFPDSIRGSGVLPLPVLAVLATMSYWLWRVRKRRAPAMQI